MPARAAAAKKGTAKKKSRSVEDDLDEVSNAKTKDEKPRMTGMACRCLPPNNSVRRCAFWFSFHPVFEAFILTCILINLCCMIYQSPLPCDRPQFPAYQCTVYYYIEWFDLVVTIIFTFETVMKITALGFIFGKFAYLKDAWNRLDFFVVVACWAAFVMESDWGKSMMGGFSINLSAFRALRALRPLKAVKFFKGVQAILESLYAAVNYLMNVGSLMMFFFAVFGILGIQMFAGVLRQHCAVPDDNSTLGYSQYEDSRGILGSCSTQLAVGYQCEGGSECLEFGAKDQVNMGYTNFDNFGFALLLMFQTSTADSWGQIMYAMMDTKANPMVPWFFIMLNVMVSTLVLNMFIAVISSAFGQVRATQDAEEKQNAEDKRASAFSYETVGEARKKKKGGCCRRFCCCLPCCFFLQPERPKDDPADESEADPPLPIPDSGMRVMSSDGVQLHLGCELWATRGKTVTEIVGMYVYHSDDDVTDMMDMGLLGFQKKEHLRYNKFKIVWLGVQLPCDADELSSKVHHLAEACHVCWLCAPQAEGRPESEAEYICCYFTMDNKFVPVDSWWSTQQIRALPDVFHLPHGKVPENHPKHMFSYAPILPMYENPVKIPYYSPNYGIIYVDDGFRPGSCLWPITWFIKQPWFDNFIMLCILGNTVTLAMERHGQDPDEKYWTDFCGTWFNWIFLAECILKIIGMGGPQNYLKVGSNMFDFIIVLSSMLPYILPLIAAATQSDDGSGSGGGPKLGLLRIFRLARVGRVVRLLYKYEDVRKLLNTVFGSFTALANLMFFLSFCLTVFAILAMQLFAGQFWEVDAVSGQMVVPRNNFDTFMDSLLALFIIMTGDNWAHQMYMAAETKESGWAGIPFFIVYFFFSSFVLLNLFVAVILENFSTEEEERVAMAKVKFRNEEKSKNVEKGFFLWAAAVKLRAKRKAAKLKKAHDDAEADGAVLDAEAGFTKSGSTSPNGKLDIPSRRGRGRAEVVNIESDSSDSDEDEDSSSDEEAPHPRKAAGGGRKAGVAAGVGAAGVGVGVTTASRKSQGYQGSGDGLMSPEMLRKASNARRLNQLGVVKSKPLAHRRSVVELHGNDLDRSLGCLKPNNPIRRLCTYIANAQLFDQAIVVVILISSFTLAIDTPTLRLNGWNGDKTILRILDIADLVFLGIFCFELVVKVISLGLIFSKDAYLSDPWNVMDFTVVCGALLGFVPGVDSSFLRILRILRVLRPLRMINKFPDLKIIINATLAAAGPLANVFILLMILFLMFAILGLSLFSGKFYRCNNPAATGKADCVGTFTDYEGVVHEAVWANPDQTFDDVWQALTTLFEVSTLASWSPVMFNAMDITDVDLQPKRNASPAMVIYFIIFVFVGAFFITQLFIGVIIDKYGAETGLSLLSSEQSLWRDMQKVVNNAVPDRDLVEPGTRVPCCCFPCCNIRKWCFDLVTDEKFDLFIMGCICVNVIFMTTEHHNMDPTYQWYLALVNDIFVYIFLGEMIVKLTGIGLKQYLSDNWNIFDGIIVTLSMAPKVAMWLGAKNSIGGVASVARTFRIGRAMRLIKRFKSLNQLFTCLLLSIPSLTHIVILYLLMLFVFAVLGIQFFAFTCAEPECGAVELNRWSNFRTVDHAMLTLFRISTFDSWPGVRADLARPNVVECDWAVGNATVWDSDAILKWKTKYHCGSPAAATYYCVSFIVVGAFIFLQLVVAVVLDNFNSIFNSESDSPLMVTDVELFKKVFRKYDVDQTGTIPFDQLYSFLTHLGEQEIESSRKSCVLGRLPGIKVYTNKMRYRPVEVKPGVWKGRPERAQSVYIGMYRRQRAHQSVDVDIRDAQWVPSITYRDFQNSMLGTCTEIGSDFKLFTKDGKPVEKVSYEDIKWAKENPTECTVDGSVVGKLPEEFDINVELVCCNKDEEFELCDPTAYVSLDDIPMENIILPEEHHSSLDAHTWSYSVFLSHVRKEMEEFSNKEREEAKALRRRKMPEANIKFAHLLYFCSLKRVGIVSMTYRQQQEQIASLAERHQEMLEEAKDEDGAGFNILLKDYQFDPNIVLSLETPRPPPGSKAINGRVHPMPNDDDSSSSEEEVLKVKSPASKDGKIRSPGPIKASPPALRVNTRFYEDSDDSDEDESSSEESD